MNHLRRISLILISLLMTLLVRAQVPGQSGAVRPQRSDQGSNLRKKNFALTADSIVLDTISIIAQTLVVKGVASTDYHLDFIKAILYWNKKPSGDSVTISYRVFFFKLNPVAQRMRADSVINSMSIAPYQFNNELTQEQKGIFNFGTLKAEGSLGRQIGFGNSQDAVLNSTLNLQLSGMLGDSIEVQAAITDNNIPIQPDGTTQQLNEFDQVFLQFKKKNWQLSLGDIDIRQNESYFLNFYKRLQGVAFQTTNQVGKNTESKTLASGSIAKGKFTRNVIEALEGNQGPYRLIGANNELFFVVLANTERVFLDGQLLQRGSDQDYVINYNTAEVTFTPQQMITKDSRIQIEFEYADRNFLNVNLYVSQEIDFNKKLKLRVGAFNNSDAKNSQINQVLDTDQKQFLAGIGDSVHLAFYPSETIDTFAAGKILYEKKISGADSIFQYSTDPLLAKYNLSFIDVGQGNGNYIPDINGANGKVYKYIAPVGTIRQGNYEPVLILVTPKKHQLINLGLDYSVNKNTWIKTEMAMSNYDANTFSKINNGDDNGLAAKFQFSNTKPLRGKNNLQLITGVDYEFVQNTFKPLERLRNVEFSRDWGLPIVIQSETENIVRATAGLKSPKNQGLTYTFTNYKRGSSYTGFQNALLYAGDWKGWQFNNEMVATRFDALNEKGVFLRPTVDLSKQLKTLKNFRIGARYAQEQNTVKNKTTDTLASSAFSFDSYSVYIKSDEAKKNRFEISFFTRSDKYDFGKSFLRGDRSYNINLQTELLANPKRQFYFNTTFRKLKVINDGVSAQPEEETILGRVEYLMNEWKGLLTGNVLYEVGTGQEQKRDLTYVEVPAGTGQYTWIDYNTDGIQQLNEFELAAFPDQATFIRILTPTNEYIKANYITFNYSFNINPRSILNKPELKGIKKTISRLNFMTSLQISNKSVAGESFAFDPFKYNVNDTALVTLNTVWLNTISFNRFHSTWGIDVSNFRNTNKTLLTYGYETRTIDDWTTKWRWNMSRSFSLSLNARKGTNSLLTPNVQFENQNYDLDIISLEPLFTFISATSFRVATGYKYENKKNLPIYGGEKTGSHSLNLESKYSVLQSSSVTGKFTFNNIDFKSATGSTTTSVSYIMLDGLLPGTNYLWSVILTKRLLNNLELNFQYDGRKPASSKTIHNGRASLTALF